MRGIKILIIICLVNTVAYGQPYFSKVYNFGWPNVVFNLMLVEGEDVYVVGIITDTVAPFFNSHISHLSIEGDINSSSSINISYMNLDIAQQNIYRYSDSTFLAVGSPVDFEYVDYAVLFELDLEGNIIKEIINHNPNFPDIDHISSVYLYKTSSNQYLHSMLYSTPVSPNSGLKIVRYDENLTKIDSLEHVDEDGYTILVYTITENDKDEFYYGITRHQVVEKGFTYENIIQKRDINFNLIWEYRTDQDSLYSSLEAMTTTSDGGVVAATYAGVEYYVNPGSNSYCRDDVYVYKLDKDGELVWEKWIPEQGCVAVVKTIKEVQELKDKTLLFAGTMPYQDKFRGTIFKLDENGEDIWYRYYIHEEKNLTSFHIFNDMALMDNGDILLCGESKGPQEGWLMRVDSMGCLIPGCNTAIDKISDEDPIDLLLYPNPVQDQLIVHIAVSPTYKEGKLSLINAMGQELKSWDNSMSELSHIVDVSEVPSGLYQLIYTSNGRVLASEQVVVER